MLRLIETFSGIGSQLQALKNSNIEHSVEAIVEWEISAMYAYDIMHNGPQNIKKYRHHTKRSLVEKLKEYNLSNNGSSSMSNRSLLSMNMGQLKALLHSIERTNNFVDITRINALDLPTADILTYSFPCQDLSVSGNWHRNFGGINREANNRSTLLWEIERLLKEYVTYDKSLPRFLLMENVSNILSDKHIGNFREWQSFLESLGYTNQVYTLDARNFGIPQSRVRTYMISVLVKDKDQAESVSNYFLLNNLNQIRLDSKNIIPISNFLRLDYSNGKYRKEAIESTPSYTPSREKIYDNNLILAVDDKAKENVYARTITTKQDRNPNSGIIAYNKIELVNHNKKYRNLTPRECFLLMGFSEQQFDSLMENNFKVIGRNFLSVSRLIRLAGNSIVVPVLEALFNQINEINKQILLPKKEGKVDRHTKAL